MTSKVVNQPSEVGVPVAERPAAAAGQQAQGANKFGPNAGKPAAPNANNGEVTNNAKPNSNANNQNGVAAHAANNQQLAAQAPSKAPANANQGKKDRNAQNGRLPQTGEAVATSAIVVAGIVLAAFGYALLKKLDD